MAADTEKQQVKPMTWPGFFIVMVMPLVTVVLLLTLIPVQVSHVVHDLNSSGSKELYAAVRYDPGVLLIGSSAVIIVMTFIFWVNTLMRDETSNDMDVASSPRRPADMPLLRRPTASWQGNSYDEFSAFNEKPVTFRQRYRQIRQQDKSNGW